MGDSISVLIADDIATTREDIKRLLYFEEDIEVIGEAADGRETLILAGELKPDIILLDINMPRMDGITAAEQLSLEVPESAVIIVSIQKEQDYLRRAMAAGARDYLIKPFSASELAQAIRRVNESHKKRSSYFHSPRPDSQPAIKPRRGKVITFFCTKGGVGKTTLATNLAVCLSQETRQKVALLDMDLTAGDASVMLNITAKGTIADLVQEQESLDYNLVDAFLVPHLSGTRILPAPAGPEQAELVTPAHVEKLLKIMANNFEYTVVDTAPLYSDINLGILEASDLVLLVLNQDLTTLKHVKTAIDILHTLNYTSRFKIVLNQQSKEGIKVSDLERTLNTVLAAIIPDDRKTVRSAINNGLPFVMGQPGSGVSDSIKDMIRNLKLFNQETGREKPSKRPVAASFFSF